MDTNLFSIYTQKMRGFEWIGLEKYQLPLTSCVECPTDRRTTCSTLLEKIRSFSDDCSGTLIPSVIFVFTLISPTIRKHFQTNDRI